MSEERTEKSRALELAVSQIEKQFGKGSIMRLGGIDSSAALDAIPSGSLSLDLALGVARRWNDSGDAASSAVHFAGARARPSPALRFGRQRHSISDQPDHRAASVHQVAARNREELHEGICRGIGPISR